ncbi:MAG: LPXTG cell wall anchor domain-containing protein [Promethearchaeota archaeon]
MTQKQIIITCELDPSQSNSNWIYFVEGCVALIGAGVFIFIKKKK